MKRPIIPPALERVYAQWHFAPAMVANGLILCSGIVGTSPDGEAPGGEVLEGARSALAGGEDLPLTALQAVRDPQAQFATAFEALRAILGEAGAQLSDIVELTTYHVDIDVHMTAFMAVKDRYVLEPYPAWTAIGVSALAVPGGLVELRAIALAHS
jgi:enamine deaminase RidA (YjgF/YER057c/UK114 family)